MIEKDVVVNKPVAVPQLKVFRGGEWRGLYDFLYDYDMIISVKRGERARLAQILGKGDAWPDSRKGVAGGESHKIV